MTLSAIGGSLRLNGAFFGKPLPLWQWQGLPWLVFLSRVSQHGWGLWAPRARLQWHLSKLKRQKPWHGRYPRWRGVCLGMDDALPRRWLPRPCYGAAVWTEL
jgi:hypothetical protein